MNQEEKELDAMFNDFVRRVAKIANGTIGLRDVDVNMSLPLDVPSELREITVTARGTWVDTKSLSEVKK